MQIGKRNFSHALGAVFKKRHYVALWNMSRLSLPFFDNFKRYMFDTGAYPYRCRVKTPTGIIQPMLYSYYDLLTLNEIFFRGDYSANQEDKVIVDIGSNIGLSALYFLTRSPDARIYLFEPDPRNIDRLHLNLENFKGRYILDTCAVSDQEGVVRFGRDLTSGRYGGIGVASDNCMAVKCRHVNSVLGEIFQKEKKIDILKIDTEGAELQTAKAISPEHLKCINDIYLECEPNVPLFPGLFSQSQEGTVCHLSKSFN